MPNILTCSLGAVVLGVFGCASIPAEAPELSTQVGSRISAMEAAHYRLLESYFNDKRSRVDEFIQNTWIPTFGENFFSDPEVAAAWDEVVVSQDPKLRVFFLTKVGPRLLVRINQERRELITPLDELEKTVKTKLKADYDNIRAMNNTLTSFLLSASKVDENRKRYLEMAGITDKMVDQFVDDTGRAVDVLLNTAKKADEVGKQIDDYKNRVNSILNTIKK